MEQLKLDANRTTRSTTDRGEHAVVMGTCGLPQGWLIVNLGALLHPVSKRQRRTEIHDDTNYTLLSVALYARGVSEKERLQGQDIKTKTWYEVQWGDFLLLKIWARKGSYGFVKERYENPIVSADYPILALEESKVDRSFLDYCLSRPCVWKNLGSGAKGSTSRQRVHERDFANFIDVSLPPLPEQRAIARVLRTVQEAIEATERVIEAAKELKRSMMEYLFTYGPVPVDQADQVELQETEFGSVPELWRIIALEKCATVQTGIAKGRKGTTEEMISVPYLRVANVQDGFLDLKEIKSIEIRPSEETRYGLQSGDVLLTEGGDFDKLGRGAIWRDEIPNCVHQNHVFAVRADGVVLSPEYLGCLVQTRYSKRYFLNVAHRTTHLACINSTKLKALPTPLPDMQVQGEIASRLESIDSYLSVETGRRQQLDSLFNSLLHHLMTGKIRVTPTETDREGTDSVQPAGTEG